VTSFSPDFDFNYKFSSPTPWRDADYLNFWLRCPAAEVTGYELLRNGNCLGYFLVSQVGNQTRIADIRVNSENPNDWKAGYALAAQTAARDAETCEIVTAASTPLAVESLKACGFRARGGMPFFLYDPQKLLTDHLPIFWNLIEGDAAFLFDPAYPFVT
jgi:hypothetical protein